MTATPVSAVTDGLVVPVDVAAYCVGTIDSRGPVFEFAGASTDYRNQTTNSRPAFLGINVTREPDIPPVWALESGVHLHWAMPDALTRGDTSSGQLVFPALPNRWLVTRIVGDGQSSKHWIVRSDALSETPPDGKPAPTVPVALPGASIDTAAGRGFRFLGAWEVYTQDWAEPGADGPRLRAMTGSDLDAVETGDIAFAAFYPNSRSSFGFRDDLAGVAAPAELMYVITGWYDDPAGDPLHDGLTVDELQTRLGWTFESASTGVRVVDSTYSGQVQGIRWNPATRYLSDEPEPIDADVAIGNHPAEALAAYFRGVDHPDLTAFEELLTLYITGLLPDLLAPAAGRLAALEESLHELQFTGIDGGTVHTVTRDGDEVGDLPLPLADALNLLNTRQQAADLAAAQVAQAKWQLFADWYRMFEVATANQTAAVEAVHEQVRTLGAIAAWQATAARAAAEQRAVVEGMLSADLALSPVPSGRYYTGSEPVVLLAGEAAAVGARYGGDGRYHPAGYLVCRLAADVLRQLTVGDRTLRADEFAALAPAEPNHLPHPEIAALIEEAALLDTAIDAAASGIAESDLTTDLAAWLAGDPARYYRDAVGRLPSPVEVGRWPGSNPWMSLTLLWDADFHPLLSTVAGGALVDYQPDFFTANYRLHADNPRLIAYDPSADGIRIDPAKIDFRPDGRSGTYRYSGSAVLSTAAADNLREQLAKSGQADPTLRRIAEQLAVTDIAMQGLTGLNDELLTRRASLQLSLGVTPQAPLPFRLATQDVMRAITSLSEIAPVAPRFNSNYSAVRAGYLRLSLQVMDPFGRKRPVRVGRTYIADSLATKTGDTTVDGVVFAQPRVAQAARLDYHWLAADSTGYDEVNTHPATTPVCGWLLPDHLAVGFFLYNAQGDPLGSLALRDDGSGIIWQATPGDEATIDADLATVLADQNPLLSELALVVGGASMTPEPPGSMSPDTFRAFWRAADEALSRIVPTASTSATGLATLVGRPLAVVQASLRLERQGIAAVDENFATLVDGRYVVTDHAVGDVGFPVVLGDLSRLDDGLVGYFRAGADGRYNTETFYSHAATGRDPRVVVPSPTNLLLRPQATPPNAPDTPPAETKLLMLVDPRVAVHATTGVVPTQSLLIPPEQYEDTLAGLELTFPVFPLLRPASGMAVPYPTVPGYEWSWITEHLTESGSSWTVDPELDQVTAGALWQYSPQSLTEGWLRLNPQVLRFGLNGPDGTPVVPRGTTTSLRLSIKNLRGVPIIFTPAAVTSENVPVQASVFTMHFGALVNRDRIAAIRPSAVGWRFDLLTDPRRGPYWTATPDGAPVTLAPDAEITMSIENVAVSGRTRAQARVYFDYHDVTGVDDGVDVAILTIIRSAAELQDR